MMASWERGVPAVVTHGAPRIPSSGSTAGGISYVAISPVPSPPTGSTAGGALVSPTPPQGGSDRVLLEAFCWAETDDGWRKLANQGTINTILLLNCPITASAQARAVVTMTEAKSAVLAELAVPSLYSPTIATGTGTDQFCLAAPLDPGRKARDSTSPHVKLGEIIGVAVKDATKEALRWQNGLEPSSVRGLFHALGRFGLTQERALSGLAKLLPEAQHTFLQKNRKAVFFEPGVAAAAYAFAAVLDRIAFGTLPAGMAKESLLQQAASLACSLAARPQDWPLFRRELAESGEVPDDTMDLVIRALALGWKSKWT